MKASLTHSRRVLGRCVLSDCGYKETEDEGQPDAQQTCTR